MQVPRAGRLGREGGVNARCRLLRQYAVVQHTRGVDHPAQRWHHGADACQDGCRLFRVGEISGEGCDFHARGAQRFQSGASRVGQVFLAAAAYQCQVARALLRQPASYGETQRAKAAEIARRVGYIELAGVPDFQRKFAEATYL